MNKFKLVNIVLCLFITPARQILMMDLVEVHLPRFRNVYQLYYNYLV
jgi:hypothetical protein